jgi:hypothetical protein
MLTQLVIKLKRAESSRAELDTSRASSRATSILSSPNKKQSETNKLAAAGWARWGRLSPGLFVPPHSPHFPNNLLVAVAFFFFFRRVLYWSTIFLFQRVALAVRKRSLLSSVLPISHMCSIGAPAFRLKNSAPTTKSCPSARVCIFLLPTLLSNGPHRQLDNATQPTASLTPVLLPSMAASIRVIVRSRQNYPLLVKSWSSLLVFFTESNAHVLFFWHQTV